jgi:hypothetical protein
MGTPGDQPVWSADSIRQPRRVAQDAVACGEPSSARLSAPHHETVSPHARHLARDLGVQLNKIRTVAAAASLGAVFALVPLPSAYAHDTCAAYGANVACVRNNHHTIDWCDRELDGKRVYAQYRVEFFTITTAYDPNGSNPGCGHRNDEWSIYEFRVCEQGSGCSAWKRS